MSDTYLVHHGVKGMRWGVRKQPESTGAIVKRKKKVSPVEELKSKEDKKQFRKDVREMGRQTKRGNVSVIDKSNGQVVAQINAGAATWANLAEKHGKSYADKVLATHNKKIQRRNKAILAIYGGLAVSAIAGSALR